MNLKAGQIVRIRPDLIASPYAYSINVHEKMLIHAGTTARVQEQAYKDRWILEDMEGNTLCGINPWTWTSELLLPANTISQRRRR